jgi:hypothetical protein
MRTVAAFLQRMKRKWRSRNQKTGHIRLNTKLVEKPKDLLEYVISNSSANESCDSLPMANQKMPSRNACCTTQS